MEPCNANYERWQQLQSLAEDLQDACNEHEKHWQDHFFGALDKLTEPEPFLEQLLRSRQDFDAFLMCKREHDHLLSTEWTDAVERLHDCVEDYAHQDSL
jgi:hypothetical protein